MGKSAKLFIALLVVVVGAGVVIFAVRGNNKGDTSTPSSSTGTSNQPETAPSGTTEQGTAAPAVTIVFSDSGFQLSATTLKAGQTVRVTNDSSRAMQLASDPHPAHTENSELNVGRIAPGESKTFKVNEKGTWGFHDHLDPSKSGSLTVE